MLAEGNPEFNPQSAENADTILKHAYYNYFNGLLLEDFSQMRVGVHTLEDNGYPAEKLKGSVRALEQSFGCDNQLVHEEVVDMAAYFGIRSYIYSGLPLDKDGANYLWTITSLVGQDRTWLRSAIDPTPEVIYELLDTVDVVSSEYHRFRLQGYKAMEVLGVATWYSKIMNAHLSRKLKNRE